MYYQGVPEPEGGIYTSSTLFLFPNFWKIMDSQIIRQNSIYSGIIDVITQQLLNKDIRKIKFHSPLILSQNLEAYSIELRTPLATICCGFDNAIIQSIFLPTVLVPLLSWILI